MKVKIRRAPDKKPKWELTSDHVGEFAQRVPARKADYIVWADLKGLKTVDGRPLHLAQEVTVHVEYDERVDIGFHSNTLRMTGGRGLRPRNRLPDVLSRMPLISLQRSLSWYP